jgi:ribonuclease P protein component
MRIGNFGPLRLKKERAIVGKYGRIYKSEHLSIKFLVKNRYNHIVKNKVAFSIKKKVANAVGRNLVKRRLRAIIAKIAHERPLHVIFIAQQGVLDCAFHRLTEEVVESLRYASTLTR